MNEWITAFSQYYLMLVLLIVFIPGVGFWLIGKIIWSNVKMLSSRFNYKTPARIGFVGIMVHEAAHFLAALLFGHKVQRVKLYQNDGSGTAGVVEHAYDTNSAFQKFGNLIIGVAPMILVSITMGLILFFGKALMDASGVFAPLVFILLFATFISLTFGLQLSGSDYKSASVGLLYSLLLILVYALISFELKFTHTQALAGYVFTFLAAVLSSALFVWIFIKLIIVIFPKKTPLE